MYPLVFTCVMRCHRGRHRVENRVGVSAGTGRGSVGDGVVGWGVLSMEVKLYSS